jgi:protein dithiol oxidoreductase (disulfide-forming)
MDCQRIDTILDEHGIGALGAAERAQVDAHLGTCRRCADAWFSHELLVSETPQGPRQGLFDEVAANAASGSFAIPVARPRFRRTAWIAAAAAALVAGIVVFSGESEQDALPQPGAQTASARGDGGGTPAEPRAPSTAAGGSASSLLAANGPEQRFVAGRDYERLPVPVPTASADGRIEVSEFFIFWCAHCYAFEPELTAWSERKPDYVDLVRVPALFNAAAVLQAQAFYTAEALGLIDEMRQPFYDAIHVRGNPLASRLAILEFFVRHGVDKARFDEVFDSLGVRAKLERAEELNRRYRVSATPSMGINGKYLTNASMTGTNEAMLEVVDSLVAAEARGLCDGDDAAECPFN